MADVPGGASGLLVATTLTGLDQAYRLRKLYLFFSICSPTLPVPGLLRHSREMTLLCSRNLTQATRLRRG
jgi:hypothetical protein